VLSSKDLEELRSKVESLRKALEGSKAVEELALEQAQKGNDVAEGLHKEVEA
jgi:hypothetical protein